MTKEEWASYMREYRARPGNKEKHVTVTYASFCRQREEAQDYVDAYKLEHGCIVCGFRESPVALDFDHRDPNEKEFTISKKLGKLTLDKIKAEIAKCDVICSNHHRMKHLVHC